MRFGLHYRNVLWRINFEVCRFKCFLKIVLNIYRALCFYVYLVGENVFMYYLVHFSFSSSFFKALVAKEWKEAIFRSRINFDISIPVFASWGIFYFLEILNQVIHSLMGLITCLSRGAELPFQQQSPCSVSHSAHRCARAITISFKRIQEVSSNTNKAVARSDPVLCSFCSCPYDAFWFSMLVGKQGLTPTGELCCIWGICWRPGCHLWEQREFLKLLLNALTMSWG